MKPLKKILGSLVFSFALIGGLHAQDTATPVSSAAPAPQVVNPAKSPVTADTVKAPAALKADTIKIKPDTTRPVTPPLIKADSIKIIKADTLKPVKKDSLIKPAADSLKSIKPDSLKSKVVPVKADTVVKTVAPAPVVATAAPAPSDNKVSCKTDWALSVKAGTLGFGGEVVKGLGKKFSARLGANFYNYTQSFDSKDVSAKFDVKLQLMSFTLLGDWYFLKTMHLSGGLVYNLNRVEMSGAPNKSFNIGSYVVSPEELGSITVKIASNKINPYLGIGFGRPISSKHRISFNTDLGILYMGGPKVEEFSATGLISPTGSQENANTLEQNLKTYSIYPVLSFQLSYRFK